ncbi:hypothetical protein [Tranquillimonas rosea]|uniref:hypothetical protein n=1 Tax=Tranquillimonas rosea TaxID=641238 RepID=UPI003BACA331
MASNADMFDQRRRRFLAKRKKLSRGAVLSVNHDGLIIARPRPQGLNFPWQGVFFILTVVLVGKAALFVALGETVYAEQTARLANGTMVEQVGGWVMQADTVTLKLAEWLRALTS